MFSKKPDLTVGQKIDLINSVIEKDNLKDCLGSSLTHYVIADLIDAYYQIRICPFDLELVLNDYYPSYVKQQNERKQAFRDYYFIKREDKKI